MIDFNKPLRMKNGSTVTLVSAALTPALASLINAPLFDRTEDTVVVKRDKDGEVYGYNDDGRFYGADIPSGFDLENYEQTRTVYRPALLTNLGATKGHEDGSIDCGRWVLSSQSYDTLEEAQSHFWKNKIIMSQQLDADGKVVSTEIA